MKATLLVLSAEICQILCPPEKTALLTGCFILAPCFVRTRFFLKSGTMIVREQQPGTVSVNTKQILRCTSEFNYSLKNIRIPMNRMNAIDLTNDKSHRT